METVIYSLYPFCIQILEAAWTVDVAKARQGLEEIEHHAVPIIMVIPNSFDIRKGFQAGRWLTGNDAREIDKSDLQDVRRERPKAFIGS